MKRKSRKLKTRIPMPPPQKPHSTKKGKRGYKRRRDKRSTFKEEEEKMSGLYKKGAMTEEARRLEAEDNYRAAIRNLSLAQVALVEKTLLSQEEEKEIRASGQLSYARELFLMASSAYRPHREGVLHPLCGLENS